LSNTYFRLSNSIGLIDIGYRGIVKAKVDIIPSNHPQHEIEGGTRYFQICRHNFMPWDKIEIVQTLPSASDDRGEGGFGSTGN
jgi:dUTPase